MVIKLTSQDCSCIQYKFSNRFDSLDVSFYYLILWLVLWSFLYIDISFTHADFVIDF
jgi:hypothetical protein